MADQVRTLILTASGAPRWERFAVDTLSGALHLGSLLGWIGRTCPSQWHRNRLFRSLVGDGYSALSYVHGWQDAFCESPWLDVTLCNVNNLLEFRDSLRRIGEYPLVVVLHSAAGDSLSLLRRATGYLQARRGKLLLFLGNEYNLMPDKIGFAREVAADFIASQLPLPAAQWLYAECTESQVLPAPAALNPRLYQPRDAGRPIDVGFRGDLYRYSLGDIERTELLRHFKERGAEWGLDNDIEFMRFPREQWSDFLSSCKGIIGAESGTYYLERDDHTQEAVLRYLEQQPSAPFEVVHNLFFRDYPNPVSGKAISSRHFEPIGTKTCQILLEGQYNGILVAGEHYIGVKKDLSNLKEAINLFKDGEYRRALVERTYEYILSLHTYRHRVHSLLESVLGGNR